MTRGRARNAGLVPTDYRQRASGRLIVTEATWVSREAIGFINVPGPFTSEQVEGWRAVTEAVHADRLNELPLSHLQVVKAPNDLAGTPHPPSWREARRGFGGAGCVIGA